MAERQELTEFERGLIIGEYLFGHSEREIEEIVRDDRAEAGLR